MTAMARYERACTDAERSIYVGWVAIAEDLRTAALAVTGDHARRLLDRADDCEARARRQLQRLELHARSHSGGLGDQALLTAAVRAQAGDVEAVRYCATQGEMMALMGERIGGGS